MGKGKHTNNINKEPVIGCCWTNEDNTVCQFKCKKDLQLIDHIEHHFKQYLHYVGKDFVCRWTSCTYSTSSINKMERHLYFHGYLTSLLANGKFECEKDKSIPKCNKPPVNRVDTLSKATEKNFNCLWNGCECIFVSIVEFHEHVLQHVNFEHILENEPNRPNKSICKWSYCNKILDNKYRLIEHIQTHTTKKNVACYQCGELFRTKKTLFEHLRRQPENNSLSHQCAQCFKFFATEKLLRAHVVKHVNRFKCSLCDMTCPSLNTLTIHIRYRHLKEKPYKCTQCNLRWVRENDLKKHIKYVHTKEVHRCDQPGCYYTVRSYNLLRRHFLEVHRNSPFIYVCHCCEKPFKTGKSLSSHLIKKHDFQLPSGHKRFTYRIDENGFYRLETMRLESLEVTQQLKLSSDPIKSKHISQVSKCFEIVSVSNKNDEATLAGEVIISLPPDEVVN